jgi:hypothetical protein
LDSYPETVESLQGLSNTARIERAARIGSEELQLNVDFDSAEAKLSRIDRRFESGHDHGIKF